MDRAELKAFLAHLDTCVGHLIEVIYEGVNGFNGVWIYPVKNGVDWEEYTYHEIAGSTELSGTVHYPHSCTFVLLAYDTPGPGDETLSVYLKGIHPEHGLIVMVISTEYPEDIKRLTEPAPGDEKKTWTTQQP